MLIKHIYTLHLHWAWCSDRPTGVTWSNTRTFLKGTTLYPLQPPSCWFIPNSDTSGSKPQPLAACPDL